MAVAPDAAAAGPARGSLVTDAILRSYAQILFARSRWVGALLLLATMVAPRQAAYGLGATVLAFAVTRLFGLSDELTRTGLFGYNGLLVGLGCAAMFGPTLDAHVVGVVGVVTAVFMTAALYSALGSSFNLPPLTLPFLFVFYLVIGSARVLDIPLSPLLPETGWFATELPAQVSLYLRSLGALFFLPRTDAGLVILLALVVHSRIAVLLSAFGYAIAFAMQSRLLLVLDGTLPIVLGYNFILTSIALGGIWFVPSAASLLLALGAAMVCGLAAVGLVPFMTVAALPVLILPFNLAVILTLYAMRQRARDAHPKAVDFAIGTPEENLNYFHTRIARFGARYVVRFHAPFRGRWVCTQGVDGEITHQGPWKHAFDFEVRGTDGRTFRGDGQRPEDFLAFRLPVLAPASGTVARVIDHVPDNRIGEPNLLDNWGNLVLIYHAPGLYSLVCHLARGSVQVREGQFVRRGDEIARCGNSGRSPVPHLHLQLQAHPTIGAPTLPAELHDVVVEDDEGARLETTLVVQREQAIRNIEPNLDDAWRPAVGQPLRFEMERDGAKVRRETILPEIDAIGVRVLRSLELGAKSTYDYDDDLWRIFDTQGDRRSVLHLLQAALPTVPAEWATKLRWSDHLQLRYFLSPAGRIVLDFASPFIGDTALRMDYCVETNATTMAIVGRSRRVGPDSQPYVTTRATFDAAQRLTCVETTVRGRHRLARRVPADDEKEPA
jgi:urea transporter